ncbi:hypothetical protein [Sulfitobacter sp. JB4-11]|uniref:hypothetical protein n=1 Tax=Sulfitobacter rhodophyticola TaxID=3238304 RepID=UPI00351321FE
MTLETVTLKLSQELLSNAARVASVQDVTVGHLVRVLLAKEVERRLSPSASNTADGGLIAALQTLLVRDMTEAENWDDLAVRLGRHGYELRPAGGGIALHKTSCGTRVCKGSDLGFAYRTFVRRFEGAMPGHPHGTLGEAFVDQPTAARPLTSTEKGRLQRALEPVFKLAEDWDVLTARMQRRGYVFRPHGTGLAIYTIGGAFVCNTATVGYRYRALVKRFGAPMPGHPHGQSWVAAHVQGDLLEDDVEVIDHER